MKLPWVASILFKVDNTNIFVIDKSIQAPITYALKEKLGLEI